MDIWLAAFTLGLAGSLHCLGMCSPLLLAVTAKRKPVTRTKVMYNLGRIFTYGLLGALVGSISFLVNVNLFQQYVSIGFGIILIVLGAMGVGAIRIPLITPAMNRFTTLLKITFSRFLSSGRSLSVLGLGMLNGLLPCGLTYLALAYCVTLAPFSGFVYMVIFGSATLPVMLGFTSMFTLLVNRFKLSLKTLTTAFLIIAGITLIGRSYLTHHEHGIESQDQITICR